MSFPTSDVRVEDQSKGFVITSFVLSAVALFFFPLLFGPAAYVFALKGAMKGQPKSKVAMYVAIAAMSFGSTIGMVVAVSTYV
jgi:hypothetical protein